MQQSSMYVLSKKKDSHNAPFSNLGRIQYSTLQYSTVEYSTRIKARAILDFIFKTKSGT